MRIIGGNERGRKIKAPRGFSVRPTTDRVKEAVFNILGARVVNIVFLDLFGGSGSIAIEAISRGADNAVIVEKELHATRIIKENVNTLGLSAKISVIQQDAFNAIKKFGKEQKQFDIIYLDPPYRSGLIPKIMLQIQKEHLLTPDGLIITETASKEEFLVAELGFAQLKNYKYGNTLISLYGKKLFSHKEEQR